MLFRIDQFFSMVLIMGNMLLLWMGAKSFLGFWRFNHQAPSAVAEFQMKHSAKLSSMKG